MPKKTIGKIWILIKSYHCLKHVFICVSPILSFTYMEAINTWFLSYIKSIKSNHIGFEANALYAFFVLKCHQISCVIRIVLLKLEFLFCLGWGFRASLHVTSYPEVHVLQLFFTLLVGILPSWKVSWGSTQRILTAAIDWYVRAAINAAVFYDDQSRKSIECNMTGRRPIFKNLQPVQDKIAFQDLVSKFLDYKRIGKQ